MFVEIIEMDTSKSGGDMQGIAMVTVADASGPLPDAMVSVSWSEATTGTDTQVSGAQGVAMLRSQLAGKKERKGKFFVATIDTLECPQHYYDSSMNVVSSGQIAAE